MKSSALGKSISKGTSGAEVQDVSRFGLWLYVNGKEYFLPYEEYPWFKNAKVSAVYNLQFHHGYHLRWPDLDVDLELESLEHPEEYPLTFREKPGKRWTKSQSSQLVKRIKVSAVRKSKQKAH